MTANPIHHDRNKHIDVDYHFFREWVAAGDLVVRYIPFSLQIADIFIKGLSSKQFLFSSPIDHASPCSDGGGVIACRYVIVILYVVHRYIYISDSQVGCANHIIHNVETNKRTCFFGLINLLLLMPLSVGAFSLKFSLKCFSLSLEFLCNFSDPSLEFFI